MGKVIFYWEFKVKNSMVTCLLCGVLTLGVFSLARAMDAKEQDDKQGLLKKSDNDRSNKLIEGVKNHCLSRNNRALTSNKVKEIKDNFITVGLRQDLEDYVSSDWNSSDSDDEVSSENKFQKKPNNALKVRLRKNVDASYYLLPDTGSSED
jgi:hypothetical protein